MTVTEFSLTVTVTVLPSESVDSHLSRRHCCFKFNCTLSLTTAAKRVVLCQGLLVRVSIPLLVLPCVLTLTCSRYRCVYLCHSRSSCEI
jgi:hypothetical protein